MQAVMIQSLHLEYSSLAQPRSVLHNSNTPSVLCHIPLLVSHTTEKKRQLINHAKSVKVLSEHHTLLQTVYLLHFKINFSH